MNKRARLKQVPCAHAHEAGTFIALTLSIENPPGCAMTTLSTSPVEPIRTHVAPPKQYLIKISIINAPHADR